MSTTPEELADPAPVRRNFSEGPHNLGAVTLLSRLVQEVLAVQLSRLGLTFAQAIVLVRLWQSADGNLPQSELIEMLVLSRASGSLVLKELEDQGFIIRSTDPVDARRLLVELTPRGEQIESDVHAAFEEVESRLFHPVGSDTWQTVYGSLRSAILALVSERQKPG